MPSEDNLNRELAARGLQPMTLSEPEVREFQDRVSDAAHTGCRRGSCSGEGLDPTLGLGSSPSCLVGWDWAPSFVRWRFG